jgi:2-hydroxychromene-2-carboxylate isomerase
MDKSANINKIIRKTYYDLDSPAAFSAVDKVYKEAKKQNNKIKRKDVINYLQSEHTYAIHRPRPIRYKRLKMVPTGLGEIQCDLAILDKLKKQNNGFPYLLVCIDILSRKITVAPAKSKNSLDMIKAFDIVFKKIGKNKVRRINTDRGLEFEAKKMKNYFDKLGIDKRVTYSHDVHAAIAERAIRTTKDRLYKYMYQYGTYNWIDVIDDIVKAINNSVNRSIGLTPNQVTDEIAQELLKKLYNIPENNKEPKFKVGDYVLIDKEKGKFSKGYLPNYTEELFKIKQVKNTNPTHYKITDLKGEDILGVFYDPNFSKTTLEPNQRISEIIKERTNRKGTKEYLVQWIGENTQEWIKENNKHFALL